MKTPHIITAAAFGLVMAIASFAVPASANPTRASAGYGHGSNGGYYGNTIRRGHNRGYYNGNVHNGGRYMNRGYRNNFGYGHRSGYSRPVINLNLGGGRHGYRGNYRRGRGHGGGYRGH